MPKRIPVQSVIVHRNGKNIVAPIGQPFDFTDAELADIKNVNPGAVRHIVNETVTAEPVAVKVDTAGKSGYKSKGETVKSDVAGDL